MLIVPLVTKEIAPSLTPLIQLSGLSEWTDEKVKNLLLIPGVMGYLGLDDNDIVGCVLGKFDPFQSEIYLLCVHPLARNKGLGSHLLESFEAELQKRRREYNAQSTDLGGPTEELQVFLEVRVSNQLARRLYEKLGYGCMRIRSNYYKDVAKKDPLLNTYEDATVYQKSLVLKPTAKD